MKITVMVYCVYKLQKNMASFDDVKNGFFAEVTTKSLLFLTSQPISREEFVAL